MFDFIFIYFTNLQEQQPRLLKRGVRDNVPLMALLLIQNAHQSCDKESEKSNNEGRALKGSIFIYRLVSIILVLQAEHPYLETLEVHYIEYA